MKLTASIMGASLFLSLLFVPSRVLGQDQDGLEDGIVKKAWEAMFGETSPEDLHTIYYESYFHGREIPGKIYIKRPNQFRNESDSITLIFDGECAVIINTARAVKGGDGGPAPVDPAYLSHFEVDIALAFPAFFEYPSKYRGTVQIGGAECWELYVDLPRGGNVSYFVDTTSHLVVRRLVSWDGDPEKELWENIISGYSDHEGILFESGYSFIGHDGREEGYFRNAEFNREFHEELFSIPGK